MTRETVASDWLNNRMDGVSNRLEHKRIRTRFSKFPIQQLSQFNNCPNSAINLKFSTITPHNHQSEIVKGASMHT